MAFLFSTIPLWLIFGAISSNFFIAPLFPTTSEEEAGFTVLEIHLQKPMMGNQDQWWAEDMPHCFHHNVPTQPSRITYSGLHFPRWVIFLWMCHHSSYFEWHFSPTLQVCVGEDRGRVVGTRWPGTFYSRKEHTPWRKHLFNFHKETLIHQDHRMIVHLHD